MNNRKSILNEFLNNSHWEGWGRTPIAGDASGRQYERLTQLSESSVILMDADPNIGEDTQHFARIADFLEGLGLSPPKILAHDPKHGFMIIEDLGSFDFAKWLTQHPNDTAKLYQAAVDILVLLHNAPLPKDLVIMTPEVGANMIGLANEWYAETHSGQAALHSHMHEALTEFAHNANTLALRDFHAENLMWRPENSSTNRIGILDFQDAFIAPAGYDLASLIRDVRRDVSPAIAENMIQYYIEMTDSNTQETRAALACLGAQRNLRILGVFARLARQKGKLHYIDMLPQVWKNLMIDLAHPSLEKLRLAVIDTLPAPNSVTLNNLRTL